MDITITQLNNEPDRILAYVHAGREVRLSHQGSICAKIIPVEEPSDAELFGMWKDREDMADVDKLRNSR